MVKGALSLGAMTAMLGVLLNLILGLSRVALAMGRRSDLPKQIAFIRTTTASPDIAIVLVVVVIAAIALLGDVRLAWSFSAFTVLVYYAVTNACALRLTRAQRLYPRWISVCGLLACLGLAFWVEPMIWMIGLGLIGAGLVYHFTARRIVRIRTSR